MKLTEQRASRLLEEYVYKVAINYIEYIDSKSQTELLRLFNRLGKDLPVSSQTNFPE